MNILFIHQNFPGQFRHLAPALAAAGHRVDALAMHRRPPPAGVTQHAYGVRRPAGKDVHPLLREAEAKVLRGEACAAAMLHLARGGYRPDLVVTNPGWGEALFVKDVFPDAKLVSLLEFFHGAPGGDFGFDPEFGQPSLEARMKHRLKNLALVESLLAMDHGVAPTTWQASRLPAEYRHRVDVIFDGIDTDQVRPDPDAHFTHTQVPETLRAGDPVVTFVNRNLEPYRGYHVFMRALPEIQRRLPDARVLLVGGDGVSYGAAAPAGTTWKQRFLDEVAPRLDLARVHFLGQLAYAQYLKLLQVSAAHVYLTYPFVLSWSCLEAMSAGCHVIASRTAPVEDFVEDGVNGHLVDFFDAQALAAAVQSAVQDRDRHAGLRATARRTVVERCDLRRVCLPQWRALLSRLAGQPA
ncbi:glycosyltransferase [Ideonella sp. YS5]|uniref:glycosyltransferase n=1 Tax=Ideonella sp. YS5 TaxID=3453714 RepID=UPI003EF012AE